VPEGTQAVYFEKEVYSLFANPNAAAVLDARCPPGPVTFVVFGVATDYCVRAAALGLLDWARGRAGREGSTVTVCTDAVAAVTPDGGREALRALQTAGVRLATVDEVLAD
jgi:nicotinamidase/pyrazinamidase